MHASSISVAAVTELLTVYTLVITGKPIQKVENRAQFDVQVKPR